MYLKQGKTLLNNLFELTIGSVGIVASIFPSYLMNNKVSIKMVPKPTKQPNAKTFFLLIC